MKTVTFDKLKQGDVFTYNDNVNGIYVVNICLRVYPKTVKVLRLNKDCSEIFFMKKGTYKFRAFNLIQLSSLGGIYSQE